MNTKAHWNPHMSKDSIAFSALLITGLVMVWFAAATGMTDSGTPLAQRSPAPSDSRIVVTAPRLKAEGSTKGKTLHLFDAR